MSWLSTLGKIAGIAGPLVAAPFSGGTSLLGLLGASPAAAAGIGAGIAGIGGVLGKGAAASEAGRYKQAMTNDQLNAGNNQAQLNAAKFNLGLNPNLANQVARGDIMSQPIQNAGTTGSGRDLQFTGGIQPSMFGADTRAAGDKLKRDALSSLMTGSSQLKPSITTLQQPGAMENIGAAAGIGGGILDTLNQFKRPMQPAAGVPKLGAPDSLSMWNQLPQIPQPQSPDNQDMWQLPEWAKAGQ